MPEDYHYFCPKCHWKGKRYRNVRKCPKCRELLQHDWRAEANELGIGHTVMGHRPLADEPLTAEQWGEVYRAYLAFQAHVRFIVLEARRLAAE